MGHEAEGSRAVLDADDDNAALGEALPEVATIPLSLEAAAMDPEEDGQTVAGRGGWGADAEVEAVFAHHIGRATWTRGLRGQGAELIALAHTFPGLGGLWRLPTEVAHWGSGVRNGFVNCELAIEDTLDVARLDMGLQKRLLLGAGHRDDGNEHEKG